jgi:hypothetical protein
MDGGKPSSFGSFTCASFVVVAFLSPRRVGSVALRFLRSQKEKRERKVLKKRQKGKKKKLRNPISKSKKASQTHRVSPHKPRRTCVYIQKTREHASKRDLLSRRRYRHQPNQRSYLIRCALLKKKLFIYVTKK